jgi:hypothetical protein
MKVGNELRQQQERGGSFANFISRACRLTAKAAVFNGFATGKLRSRV